MPFNERNFEGFAMQAEKTSQNIDPSSRGVDVEEVGKALGLSRDESIEYAEFLKDEGWALTSYQTKPLLRLTRKGFAEIAKLRWPPWRRWIHKHESVITMVAAAIGVVVGVVALAVSIAK